MSSMLESGDMQPVEMALIAAYATFDMNSSCSQAANLVQNMVYAVDPSLPVYARLFAFR